MSTSHASKSSIWQYRALEHWIKTVLTSQLIDPGATILELCCGKGLDTGKWDRAKIGRYVGVDNNQSLLDDAKERWLQKHSPFPASFHQINLTTQSLDAILDPGLQFDVVVCYKGLSDSCESETALKQFLKNAICRLKEGGFFYGIVADSSAIWCKAQKQTSDGVGSTTILSDLYSIKFEDTNFNYFGSKYILKLDDTPSEQTYMVHFPSFLQFMNELGFDMIEITNFNDIYEDYKRTYHQYLKSLNAFDKKGKLHTDQMEILGLYAAFIFKKRENS